jgi:seryl-tRNA synthetase
MLQINYVRENTDRVIAGLTKRNFKDINLVHRALALDDERKEIQKTLNDRQSRINTDSKQVGEMIRTGKTQEAESLKSAIATDKKLIRELEDRLAQNRTALDDVLYPIPNVPHDSVPPGIGTEGNVVVHEHGAIPKLELGAQPHWDLIKKYDIIDFELGTKISGAGFPVYKGKGARLQRALINFFLDEAAGQGYREIQPPIVVNEASGFGTGQLPDKEGQMYYIPEDKLYLIPTAEVPITNLYRDILLAEEELPVKNAGYTPCFRREAGSWGAHVRGLNRLHQFDKVEIVQIRTAEESYAALEEMCLYVQGLLEKLELPYHKLLLCGGDMGFNSAMTFDMEVYAGAQQRWLEVSSVSNFETFQANRLKLRYKNKEGKTQLLHTLNGSALALPRIVAAILENNQFAGGIRIPKVLVPYTGFDVIA